MHASRTVKLPLWGCTARGYNQRKRERERERERESRRWRCGRCSHVAVAGWEEKSCQWCSGAQGYMCVDTVCGVAADFFTANNEQQVCTSALLKLPLPSPGESASLLSP